MARTRFWSRPRTGVLSVVLVTEYEKSRRQRAFAVGQANVEAVLHEEIHSLISWKKLVTDYC